MDMTKAELDAMYEASKLDTTMFVGSEIRQLIGMIVRLQEKLATYDQAKLQLKAAVDLTQERSK